MKTASPATATTPSAAPRPTSSASPPTAGPALRGTRRSPVTDWAEGAIPEQSRQLMEQGEQTMGQMLNFFK